MKLGFPCARRSNQSILKEISPGCSLEGMMLKLKLQYFGHLMRRVDSLEKTDGRNWGQEEKGTTEDEMDGWHHRLDGCRCEWTPRVGDGQGRLVCCNSWGRKESDTTERLNWLNWTVAQLVKNLPTMQETWVQSLGWEDTLEKGKGTHSSILAWRIPGTIQFLGSQRFGHDWVTFTKLLTPIKTDNPQTLVPLLPSEMANTLCIECVSSLNKPSFTLLWLTLESSPVWSQEPTLGSRPRDITWDVTIFSHPTLFPAIFLLGLLSVLTQACSQVYQALLEKKKKNKTSIIWEVPVETVLLYIRVFNIWH